MLGQVGLLRGLADRDILRAAGDGQHRAARARQLRKYRGSVSQQRRGGPRAAGGRQGGRADSPMRVRASAPPGESGARAAGGDEAVELQRGRSGLQERGAGGAGGRPGGAAPAGGSGGEQEPKPAGRNRSRPLPPAAGAARRGPAQALANMMTGRAGGRGGRAAPLGAGAAGRGGDIWAQLCRSFAPGRCRTAALSGCYAARPWRPGLQRTLLLHVPRVPACLLPAGYRFALLPAPPELANLQGRAICMAGGATKD